MKMLIPSMLAAAAILGQSGIAHAQDWQGAYLSGFAGYGFKADDDDKTIRFDTNLDGNFGDTVNTAAGVNAFSPGFCNGMAIGATPDLGCEDDDGAVDYGIRAGQDGQYGSLVVGYLIEVSRNEIEDSVAAFSTTPAQYTMTRELTALVAARLRGGFAFSNFLVYGTGGYAIGLMDRSFSTSNGVNSFIARGSDRDAHGYQYGGGAEWAISPKWRFGAEYIRTELKDEDYRVRAEGPAAATNPFLLVNTGGTDFARSDDKFKFDSVRLTLSYRLGAY